MRKGLIALSLVALSAMGLPARAAATGSIEGRVLDGRNDEPVAGVRVTLTSGDSEGNTERTVVETDARGRYRFSDLPAGADHIYALDARYEGGLFPGRALTIPDNTSEEPVIDTTLKVWPTTTDPDAIVVARNDLFVVEAEGGNVAVVETVRLTNTSEDAYIGRGSSMTSEARTFPSLGFALPSQAEQERVQIVDSSLDIPELLRTDFGFGITTAIPPGSFSITFAYQVPGVAASYDLSRRMLYPTLNFALFASENLKITSNRLDEGEQVEIEGKTYVEHSTSEELEPADPVQVVALADAGTPAGLLAGMAGALVLVAALGLFPLLRSRRTTREPKRSREDLLTEIAELDLRHERGEIDDEEWSKRRADLRGRIRS
ncbi:MAG: carboxypeptidase regulatory-like domain-containing protein [Actinomycetota bacterium]